MYTRMSASSISYRVKNIWCYSFSIYVEYDSWKQLSYEMGGLKF